jgi:hypothetical protein
MAGQSLWTDSAKRQQLATSATFKFPQSAYREELTLPLQRRSVEADPEPPVAKPNLAPDSGRPTLKLVEGRPLHTSLRAIVRRRSFHLSEVTAAERRIT